MDYERQTGHAGYSKGEEIANTITHGIGALLSVAALPILAVLSSDTGNAWTIVSLCVFGSTLILLYTMSTLYHILHPGRAKAFFKLMDHASIYLLIAGSYTPILLSLMRTPLGWSLFGVIWGLALAGVSFKVFYVGRFKKISTLIYLAMGWIIILAVKPFVQAAPPVTVEFIVAGGLLYTLGTPFYIWKAMPYNHAVWHLFVVGGSVCHFFAFALGLT